MDKRFIGLIGLAAAFFALAFWMSGCSWREVIPVNTPAAVVDSGTAPRMSLSDSEAAFEVWKVKTTRAAQDWAARIEDGNSRVAFVESLVQLGLDSASGSFPGAAIVFGGLLGTAGLLKRKPGDDKLIADKDKDNAALKAEIAGLRMAVSKNTSAREGGDV